MVTEQISVLLVDDHAMVRAGIRQFLEQTPNIKILAEVSSAEEAKQFLVSQLPDVATVDIQLPHENGILFTKWLAQTHPQVGVLILTAHDDEQYMFSALQAGAKGYMLKTSTPTELGQAVIDINAGKTAIPPQIAQKIAIQLTHNTPPAPHLTPREAEVLTLVSQGLTNKEIGKTLQISDRTVQGHLAHIYEKLNVNTRTEAAIQAVALGLIVPS